jgi:hypothetical protein
MADYRAKMESRGIAAFGVGISHGSSLQAAMMEASGGLR